MMYPHEGTSILIVSSSAVHLFLSDTDHTEEQSEVANYTARLCCTMLVNIAFAANSILASMLFRLHAYDQMPDDKSSTLITNATLSFCYFFYSAIVGLACIAGINRTAERDRNVLGFWYWGGLFVSTLGFIFGLTYMAMYIIALQ